MSSEEEPLVSTDSKPQVSPKVQPLLANHRAQELAAAADTLAKNIGDFVTADVALLLAEAAREYTKSPWEQEAERLADAAAEFVVFFTNQAVDDPGVTATIKAILLAAANLLPVRHLRPPDSETKEKQLKAARKLDPTALAFAAAVLAAELHDTDLGGIARAFAYHASRFASSPEDVEVKTLLAFGEMILQAMAAGTQHAIAVSDLMVAADHVIHSRRRLCFHDIITFLRCASVTPDDEEWIKKHLEEVNKVQKLACKFAEMAAHQSSMVDEAAGFSKAVDGLALDSKIDMEAYTELGNASRKLLASAIAATPSDAIIAAAAKVASANSLKLYFSARARRVGCLESCGLGRLWAAISCPCPRLALPTGCGCCGWLRAAIADPEQILPMDVHYAERKAKTIAQHQIVLGIALATPVVLLTSARDTNIFPADYAIWIGGTSLGIWVFVSGGMLMNLHGRTRLEMQIARHLSRLGMMGLTLLLCFYTFYAFFPEATWLLWVAVLTGLAIHGALWIASCVRGDDDSSVSSKTIGCNGSGKA